MRDETHDRLMREALGLHAGLSAWRNADPAVDDRALSKAFRDNWDRRIGALKFGGVWSISMARGNPRHPARLAALEIPRQDWTGRNVTVEYAMPVGVLCRRFMRAAGLQKDMPPGWEWGGDPFARWKAVGIEVPQTRP